MGDEAWGKEEKFDLSDMIEAWHMWSQDQKQQKAVPDLVCRSVLRDSLKRVKWDPRVVPRKTESGRFGRDSAKQVNIPRRRAERAIGSRLVRRARISPT